MKTDQAVARQAARENMKHLQADTVELLKDVLHRLDTIDVSDPTAVGKLSADAKFALICMRDELGVAQ